MGGKGRGEKGRGGKERGGEGKRRTSPLQILDPPLALSRATGARTRGSSKKTRARRRILLKCPRLNVSSSKKLQNLQELIKNVASGPTVVC